MQSEYVVLVVGSPKSASGMVTSLRHFHTIKRRLALMRRRRFCGPEGFWQPAFGVIEQMFGFGVPVCVGVPVTVCVGVPVMVPVAVETAVPVADVVGVADAEAVAVTVAVAVSVDVAVSVAVAVCVAVAVGVGELKRILLAAHSVLWVSSDAET